MLGSWPFRSSSFRNSLFSQVAMHSGFMVCLSTSSLSRDIFLAGQASAAKAQIAGPCCVHGLFEKDLLHVCWRQLGTRQKKKSDSVYVCGFIGVLWRRVGNPTKKRRKSPRRSAPCTGLLRLNEHSFARWPHASRSRSAALGNAADKRMRTDRQYYFIDIDKTDHICSPKETKRCLPPAQR